MRLPFAALLLASVFLAGTSQPACCDEVALLEDFETADSLAAWDFVSGTPKLVTEGATSGQRALEVTFDPNAQYQAAYLYWSRVPADWSAWDALVLDVTNPAGEPVPGYLLVADGAWEDGGRSYWNRHNASTSFPPGRSEWTIPVRGLFRGEAGSRNNDIKRDIDPDQIVRLDFGFGSRGAAGRILIDNLRFVKQDAAQGVWAFDFGPASQPVMLGWTPVANGTAYDAERGYGWGPQGGTPWNGAARDNTFGTSLIQDFCEAGGYNFHVDVPPGQYRCQVIYENCGYWGGEQAQQSTRRILANGDEVWREDRPDGSAHALYRFEDVEPMGADIWDTYMRDELAKPAVFEADADEGGLTFRFEADKTWGSKVSALVLHASGDGEAAEWVARQWDAVATEFRRKAACLDAPAPEFTCPEAWATLGFVSWPADLEEDITPNSIPPDALDDPADLAVSRVAVPGEYEPFCLALRPVTDLGECGLQLEPLTGPAELEASLQVVRYNTSRGFGNIAYHVQPHTLRHVSAVELPADITREIIVTARVPQDAAPGTYTGALTIDDPQGKTLLRVPLELQVRPVKIPRETDFLMGFFGLMPPGLIPGDRTWEVLEETLITLREHGMNAVSGGPDWRLTGWQNGQPQIDFGSCDRFFALLSKHGFTYAINGYGGMRFAGLHDRYTKGAAGERVEEQSGLPYEDAMMAAWEAVDAHARANAWPTIFYAMCDETRVREAAEAELEFMKIMAKVSAAFPDTIRTSGSYSVNFKARPEDRDDMLYWHQRFFEDLDISSLNNHDPTVMAEAAKLGKQVHIYNQGRTRYSFGLYQWSEFRKGVAARWQWHLNVLHGYQFFDLDGREPDTAMLCYGREAIYPTIHFERCREGAEDFYLYQTLHDLLNKIPRQATPEVTDAHALLKQLDDGVALNQRQPPDGFDADAVKLRVIEAIEKLN